MTDKLGFVDPTLIAVVERITYKTAWYFNMHYDVKSDGSGGWTFSVVSCTEDSMKAGSTIRVQHCFLVPPAVYNRNTWVAWVFDRIRDVETHEAGEFFRVSGVREFAPHHSNGEDPYRVWHTGDYATAAKRAGDS